MKQLNLTSFPNQEFTTMVGSAVVTIRLHYFRDLMYCGVETNGVRLVDGVRCIRGEWILPKYIESQIGGNIMFSTTGSKYPTYEDFENGSCTLEVYDQEEVNGLRG